LVADPPAASRLAGWGGTYLRPEKIQQLLSDARYSQGVRQTAHDVERIRKYAAKALAARREMQQARRQLRQLARKNPVICAIASVVGLLTACVLYVYLGDPHDYHCGAAYRKAMGLNLKERSSGRWQGKLKITKRGWSQVRRWMYLSALRSIRQASLGTWYQAKKERDQGRARGALVGIMRRLALATYHVRVTGEPFDIQRLFPGKNRPRRRAMQV
jgi:transposase